MAISTNYHNGIPCYVISDSTAYELPACEASEPRYIRNAGPDILVVSARSGQTIDSGASASLSPDDCMLVNPIGTDWVLIIKSTDTLGISQIGYTTGTGGSVTQITSVNTAVTLNKPCGKITMFAHDFSNNDVQSFQFNNSFIEEDDVIVTNIRSGSNKLNSQVDEVQNGNCNITIADLHNQSTGVINVVINYAVIKGDS
tara:strand:+ start:42 stop:641 length:600 start_codon:yes stop_codon:yes gene_type:complete